MLRYIGGRLVSGLLTLFLFVTALFFLVNIVIPGDWVSQFILPADAAEALREELGLNRPLWQQYFTWLGGLFTLSLGESFARGEVWDALMATLPSTLLVLIVGLLIAFVLGGWMGRYASHEQGSFFAGPMTFVAILFLTAFPPVLAILMEQGILNTFNWAGLGAFGTLDELLWGAQPIQTGPGQTQLVFSGLDPAGVMWRMVGVVVATVVVLWLFERLLIRFGRRRIPRWLFLILMVAIPLGVWWQMGLNRHVLDIAGTLTLLLVGVVLLTFGDVMLVTRAAMEDSMLEDYVMVARAKGLPEKEVRDRHAARTALLPVLSRFAVSVPYFLTGLIILEEVFAGAGASVGVLFRVRAPEGLGVLLFDAVRTQDQYLIVGAMLAIGALTLFLRIVLDVLHAALDPRIKFGEENAS